MAELTGEAYIASVGLETLNNLRLALAQSKWLDEIIGRFEEIGLPDGWARRRVHSARSMSLAAVR
jgi:hypothetical protein